jgi:hypothetical protein
MNDHPNAPGNDQQQERQPTNSVRAPARQEIEGPLDALHKSALDVGVLRMELDVSMEHALRHPRRMAVVQDQIRQMALFTDASANRCVYALPRKDKAIIGPSIGLATITATAWGNCIDRGWWVHTDRTNKVVVCEGMFRDLQTNRTSSATVTRRISGKNGLIYSDDMIAVTIQAATSIAQRNAIFKGVSDVIWRPIYEEALVIVRGTTATLPERRAKMIATFANFGVTPQKIFAALGIRDEKEITLDHMVMLRGMYEQLKDEVVTADELFDPRFMTSGAFDRVDNPLGDDGSEQQGAHPHQVEGSKPATSASPADAAGTTAADRPIPQGEPAADHQREPATQAAKTTLGGNGGTTAQKQATHASDALGATHAAPPPAQATGGLPLAGGDGKKPGSATEFPDPEQKTGEDYLAYVREKVARLAIEGASPTAIQEWFKGPPQRDIRAALGEAMTTAELDACRKAVADAQAKVAQ